MRIFLNETPRDLPDSPSPTVESLLMSAGLPSTDGVAVAVNDAVVSRSGWASRALAEGDRVLVIRATQGG